MKKVYKSMNIAKGIAIILVVFVHSLPNIIADKPNFNGNQIIEFIYNFSFLFFMPLFFFVSGFLSTKIINFDKRESISYIKKKFDKLMIPYFIISLLGIIVKLCLSSFAIRDVNIFNMLKSILFYPCQGSIRLLWFVYTLFLITIAIVSLRKIPMKFLIILFTLTSIVPINFGSLINLDGILQYAIYYCLGMYSFKFYEEYKEFKFKNIIAIITFIMLIIMNTFAIQSAYKSLFTFISSVIGIICFINISILIENTKIGEILQELGRRSFDVYLFSWFFQSFFRILLFQILKLNYNITFIFMFIGGFLPLIFINIIRKNKIINKSIFRTNVQ